MLIFHHRKSSIQAKSLPQSTGPVSSESEDEEQEDGEKGLLRKVSTKKQLHSKVLFVLIQTFVYWTNFRSAGFAMQQCHEPARH